MISLLPNCGNIAVICSTCANVKRCPFRRGVWLSLDDREDIKYLIKKKERNATKASEGIERVASSSWEAMKDGSFQRYLERIVPRDSQIKMFVGLR